MAAQRGAFSKEHRSATIIVKLENHGTFVGRPEAVVGGLALGKQRLAGRIAGAYAGHHDGFETVSYWRQYPIDILAVIAADLWPDLDGRNGGSSFEPVIAD
jgi:hypothetical protein